MTGTSPQSQSHPDCRGVFVELWTIDLMDSDHAAALLLSQLLWWHQPSKGGRPKLSYEREGSLWLLRADDDWWADCRLTQRQVRRIRSVLIGKGLVEHRRFKLNGTPTSAWRPILDAIPDPSIPIRPDPELPSERHFQGTDALTSLPCPCPPLGESKTPASSRPQTPEQKLARRIVTDWHDSTYPKPIASFMGAVKIVERYLLAGQAPNAVARALREAPCTTIPAMDIVLNRSNGTNGHSSIGDRNLSAVGEWIGGYPSLNGN